MKQQQQPKKPPMSGTSTPRKGAGGTATPTPARAKAGGNVDQRLLDLAAMNLTNKEDEYVRDDEPPPKMSVAKEKVLEEARNVVLQAKTENGVKAVSLVVIGVCIWFEWLDVKLTLPRSC